MTRIWILLIILTTALQRSESKIHVGGKYFMDRKGRVRLFRGINSVTKKFPWYDPQLLDSKRQLSIKNLGFNVIRLGAMWSGFEPEEGQYNETYIGVMKQIVSDFSNMGVYVLLDMHQDVLWAAGVNETEGYWGIPKWIKAKLKKPSTDHLFPWPFTKPLEIWECGYFTKEISLGFQQFYDNVNGVADAFANFWQRVALEFKQFDNVLGYELINEPFGGNLFDSLQFLLPGIAGELNLAPLYERASGAIRNVDMDTIIFFEPVTWALFYPYKRIFLLDQLLETSFLPMNIRSINYFLTKFCGPMDIGNFTKYDYYAADFRRRQSNLPVLGPGFKQVPGGEPYLNRSALSWHYYCSSFSPESNGRSLTQFACDSLIGPDAFRTAKIRSDELGCASMLTEFGNCFPNITSPKSVDTRECLRVMELADGHFQSWSYWNTADGNIFWDENGNLIEDIVFSFTRPYPMATAGKPISLSYDPLTRIFLFSFYMDTTLDANTVIFIPPLVYGERIDISASSNLQWEFSVEDPNILLLFPSKPKIFKSSKAFVRISSST